MTGSNLILHGFTCTLYTELWRHRRENSSKQYNPKRNLFCSRILVRINRPFPSSLVPLFQSESKWETILMKMSSTCSFIFMQIKLIFIRMVSHLDSL